MAENGLRLRTATKFRLRILEAFTFIIALAAAVCWGWWKYQRDKASDELQEAASSRAWDRYQDALRNEWPALDWFIASIILLLFAIAIGAATLLYWIVTRRRQENNSK